MNNIFKQNILLNFRNNSNNYGLLKKFSTQFMSINKLFSNKYFNNNLITNKKQSLNYIPLEIIYKKFVNTDLSKNFMDNIFIHNENIIFTNEQLMLKNNTKITLEELKEIISIYLKESFDKLNVEDDDIILYYTKIVKKHGIKVIQLFDMKNYDKNLENKIYQSLIQHNYICVIYIKNPSFELLCDILQKESMNVFYIMNETGLLNHLTFEQIDQLRNIIKNKIY